MTDFTNDPELLKASLHDDLLLGAVMRRLVANGGTWWVLDERWPLFSIDGKVNVNSEEADALNRVVPDPEEDD